MAELITERQRNYMIAISKALNIQIPTNVNSKFTAALWLSTYAPKFQEYKHQKGTKHMNEEHTVADRPPVGTELIIISTSGHGFPKGAIVTIDKELSERDIREGIVHAVDSNGYGQYLKPENFEIYIPESPEAIEENPDYKETHLTFDEIYNEIMKGSYHA